MQDQQQLAFSLAMSTAESYSRTYNMGWNDNNDYTAGLLNALQYSNDIPELVSFFSAILLNIFVYIIMKENILIG